MVPMFSERKDSGAQSRESAQIFSAFRAGQKTPKHRVHGEHKGYGARRAGAKHFKNLRTHHYNTSEKAPGLIHVLERWLLPRCGKSEEDKGGWVSSPLSLRYFRPCQLHYPILGTS